MPVPAPPSALYCDPTPRGEVAVPPQPTARTCAFPAKNWIICCMSCCWGLEAPAGEDAAGGAGEEAGASGAGPALLPAEGGGVRVTPKEPRLQAGETESRGVASGKGVGTRGPEGRAGGGNRKTDPQRHTGRSERQRAGSLPTCPPSPGHQPGGLGLQGLQPLLDLQQRLHGAGVGEDRERLRVLHLGGRRENRAWRGARAEPAPSLRATRWARGPLAPAAGRPEAADGAAPAAVGSPRTAARSPSSAKVKVVGEAGPTHPENPPQPQSPSAPHHGGEPGHTPKYPGGLSGTVTANGATGWATTSVRSHPVSDDDEDDTPGGTAPTTSQAPGLCVC